VEESEIHSFEVAIQKGQPIVPYGADPIDFQCDEPVAAQWLAAPRGRVVDFAGSHAFSTNLRSPSIPVRHGMCLINCMG
jgi:hypothetical protein